MRPAWLRSTRRKTEGGGEENTKHWVVLKVRMQYEIWKDMGAEKCTETRRRALGPSLGIWVYLEDCEGHRWV